MNQNSIEWHSWRNQGIGASDSPVLLGYSKTTPYELYQQKKNKTDNNIGTYAKAKGGEVEAQLRARYSLSTGLQFEPACAEMEGDTYIRCSYDGIALENGKLRAIEIKFVGLDYYNATTLPSNIKTTHFVQMQHQMLVMDLEYVDYLYSADTVNYKRIRVFPDIPMHRKIQDAAKAFYECLVTNTPPPLGPDDWHDMPSSIQTILEGPMDEDARNKIKVSMEHRKVESPSHRVQLDKRGALRITKRSLHAV